MSKKKKEQTVGKEFENFLEFAIKYKVNVKNMKKSKTLLTFQEYRDFVAKNNISENDFRKRLKELHPTMREGQINEFVRKVYHPTEKDFEQENSDIYKRNIENIRKERKAKGLSY